MEPENETVRQSSLKNAIVLLGNNWVMEFPGSFHPVNAISKWEASRHGSDYYFGFCFLFEVYFESVSGMSHDLGKMAIVHSLHTLNSDRLVWLWHFSNTNHDGEHFDSPCRYVNTFLRKPWSDRICLTWLVLLVRIEFDRQCSKHQ